MEQLKILAAQQKDRLHFYNPYNYLRDVPEERLDSFTSKQLENWLMARPNFHIFETTVGNQTSWFLYEFLPWDTNYFKLPTYRFFTAFFSGSDFEIARQAVQEFKNHLKNKGTGYCFINLPAEDIFLLQALTGSGFALIETRLNFYRNNLADFEYARFPVRTATPADIPLLKEVAATCRNNFDRYHADVHFPQEQADAYLSTYAEACVNGLTETVLIPDEKLIQPAAFMAISRLKKDAVILNLNLAQITLTAVSPVCKGWHLKLASETLQYAKAETCDYVLMTTQATNRAVFRTSEKLGFKLGNTTHILAVKF